MTNRPFLSKAKLGFSVGACLLSSVLCGHGVRDQNLLETVICGLCLLVSSPLAVMELKAQRLKRPLSGSEIHITIATGIALCAAILALLEGLQQRHQPAIAQTPLSPVIITPAPHP